MGEGLAKANLLPSSHILLSMEPQNGATNGAIELIN
jgi:hypothetical protein